MKNEDQWRPSKYVYRGGRLAASRDPSEVGVGSRLIVDLVARRYEEELPRYAKGRLVDLGCGKVPLYGAYRDLVIETVCVDWENTLHEKKHLDHECDLGKPLPFSDGEFDTVLLSDVIEHIPEPQLLCNEVGRILAIGGRLLLNAPFLYWQHELPHDYYRYTEPALRRLLEKAGLRVVSLTAIGGSPEVLADIVAKHLARIPFGGRWLSAALQRLVYLVVTGRVGGRISMRTALAFPLGYFVVAEK